MTIQEQVGHLAGDDVIIPPGEENGIEPPEPQGWIESLQADTPFEETHQRKAFGAGSVNPDGTQRMLTYVTARFVQDRLDNAVGPANWSVAFETLGNGAVRCGISIRIPDEDATHAEWVTKWDVGTPSNIEPDKGAHSDAFKRAGVMWGIARDLYDERDDKEGLQVEPQPQAQPMAADAPPRTPEQMALDAQTMANGWFCPVHNDVKVVPAGISQRTQRPYSAFRACPVPGCDQKEPFRR